MTRIDVAKVKEEGDYYIYEYYDNDVKGGYQATKKKSSTGDSNNRMYVVQITNTPKNSKYKIGHVTNIDKNTKLSSEDVVSPAFMLASQLGTVYAFTGKNDGKNASEPKETPERVLIHSFFSSLVRGSGFVLKNCCHTPSAKTSS